MTNLDKWKKEQIENQIENIRKMNIEDAVESIKKDFYNKCKYCVNYIPDTFGCPFVTCTKGIKSYLERESEE